jgi:hypothetical protein
MHLVILGTLGLAIFTAGVFTLSAITYLGMPEYLGLPVGITLGVLALLSLCAAHPLFNAAAWAVVCGPMIAIAFKSDPDVVLRVAIFTPALAFLAAGASFGMRAAWKDL